MAVVNASAAPASAALKQRGQPTPHAYLLHVPV